jgi:RecB family exonuclease
MTDTKTKLAVLKELYQDNRNREIEAFVEHKHAELRHREAKARREADVKAAWETYCEKTESYRDLMRRREVFEKEIERIEKGGAAWAKS